MNWDKHSVCRGMRSNDPADFRRARRRPNKVVREGSFELDIKANRALDFFTPEGERAWVKGWDPKPLYPPQVDVPFKANSVFHVAKNIHSGLS